MYGCYSLAAWVAWAIDGRAARSGEINGMRCVLKQIHRAWFTLMISFSVKI